MLDRDAVRHVLFGEKAVREFLKHLRQAFVKFQIRAERFQLGILRPIHPERVEQHLHVSEFAVVALLAHQFGTAPPEARGVNPKRREHHLVLHVARAERLIVIVHDRDRILRRR
jgi:hypothetical protein